MLRAVRWTLKLNAGCVALLLCIGPPCCHAHPTSHIDAWARVGTHLNVRLTLFLDDVLATQGLHQSPNSQLLPAATVRTALAQFEHRIPVLFAIYDCHGQELSASIARRPQWKIPVSGVNILANAGLRLTWELNYPWMADSTSFSVRHRFTRHEEEAPADVKRSQQPVLPAELRLRVRSDHSGRRIAAVVGHHLPHTIVLPEALPESSSHQNQTPATAGFILLPTQLIHEFSVPLVLTPISNSPEDVRPAQQTEASPAAINSILPRVDVSATIQLAEEWRRQHLRFEIDDVISDPQSCVIQLLTPENELIPPEASVPSIGTRLGIRTVYAINQFPRQVTVSWTAMPKEIQQVVLHSQTGTTATTQTVDQRHQGSVADLLTYSWEVPPRVEDPDNIIPWTEAADSGESFDAVRLWTRPTGSLWVLGAACLILLAAAIVLIGSQTGQRRRTSLTLAACCCLALVAAVACWPDVRPDPDSATEILASMLKRVYFATLVEVDELRVRQLSGILTDDLVEVVHEQIASSQAVSDNSPLIRIDGVQLTECSMHSFNSGRQATFDCQWQVDGQILHWGHRHQRQLRMLGLIRLDTAEDRIRISQISLNNVQYDDSLK